MSVPGNPSDAEIRAMLVARPTVALVGASANPERPSHQVMADLLDEGYTVIPVNPRLEEVHGVRCYPDLASVPIPIDIVDVFRRAEATPDVARQAVAASARVLWLQLGVINDEARQIAESGGLKVVMDRCLSVDHHRLVGAPFPPPPAVADVGLCASCVHARRVPTTRTEFWLCRRSATEPSYPRYPRLPVRQCPGYEPGEPRPGA